MKNFSGNILFLDRSDINTDEIIPAKYLTEISKTALKPHLLEDLRLEEFIPGKDIEGNSVVVTRSNFGCGSSREHAPWALQVNGIHLVIAESFARIFKRNMFNCGMLAAELLPATIDYIFATYGCFESHLETDLENQSFTISSNEKTDQFSFSLSVFDLALIKAGGWVEYADLKY
jgi:3-isopropylmalate/(R)-2-methylmalate dehydratase small subunit